jgi:hypothetical protein
VVRPRLELFVVLEHAQRAAGGGIAAGWDSESAVSDRCTEPFRFSGGLDRVVLSLSGEAFEDLDRRVQKAFLVD